MTIDCPDCDGTGLEDLDHLWPSWRGLAMCLQCDGECVISLCVSTLERGQGWRGRGMPDPWFGETARDKVVDVDDYIAKAVFGTAVAQEEGPLLDKLRKIWAEDDALAGDRADAVDRAMKKAEGERRVRRVETTDFKTPEQKLLARLYRKRDPAIDYRKVARDRAADIARQFAFSAEESLEEARRLEAAADRERRDWKKRRLLLAAKNIRLNLEHAERLSEDLEVAPLL